MRAMVSQAAATDNGRTVASRIQASLPVMPTAMSKIADVLLENPAAPINLSITELAEEAGTSAATVTRFCKLIGYSGYTQFRVGVASDIGRGDAHESWRADIGREFHPEDKPREVLRTLLNEHVRGIEATAGMLDLDELESVARAIATCRHLDIYGIGGSAVMAGELQARLYRIGVNAHCWGEVHGGLTSAALQSKNSVAIGISNTGRTDETIQMLSQAASSGAFTVAVTHAPESPLAALADVTIITAAPDLYLQPDDLSAKHSQLFVLDMLYLLVAQQNFAETATKLAASAMAVSGHRRPQRPARQGRRPSLRIEEPAP
ncbi:DNA-binding transcriptional regulator, MurR/RpiR family, contains HTH and SIS domains [Paramicrobacterium humi]|uniref:DNA-binding transcriptional regulator, MurR/RpiR family, contains HTH and SIS domains n=2 Tax=Paramicrobacterium humi TaxID=640635 RepID=A0A1H4J5J6_9MICO|nr:DNA-binding transcriptional regulator, MurR/RpiR family, contains HTH and SIS domains [Microbacterium humi]